MESIFYLETTMTLFSGLLLAAEPTKEVLDKTVEVTQQADPLQVALIAIAALAAATLLLVILMVIRRKKKAH